VINLSHPPLHLSHLSLYLRNQQSGAQQMPVARGLEWI
jgi:hypothetical protein